jgi:hypothetical protein
MEILQAIFAAKGELLALIFHVHGFPDTSHFSPDTGQTVFVACLLF